MVLCPFFLRPLLTTAAGPSCTSRCCLCTLSPSSDLYFSFLSPFLRTTSANIHKTAAFTSVILLEDVSESLYKSLKQTKLQTLLFFLLLLLLLEPQAAAVPPTSSPTCPYFSLMLRGATTSRCASRFSSICDGASVVIFLKATSYQMTHT